MNLTKKAFKKKDILLKYCLLDQNALKKQDVNNLYETVTQL